MKIEALMEQAIEVIARIQAPAMAFERNSIAAGSALTKPSCVGIEFLFLSLLGSLRGETLRHGEAAELKAE